MTEQFIRDRSRTHQAQAFVADRLRAQGFSVKVVKDGYFPDYDLLAEKSTPSGTILITGEVKRDYRYRDTGNLALELDALNHSRADYLFFVIDEKQGLEAWVCPLAEARALAEEYPVKRAVGEHGEVCSLVPRDVFVKKIVTRRI